jgi:hypothetical protein
LQLHLFVTLWALQDEPNPRKTKIVCTLGPSCWGEAGLAALMDAGMNVARFNFSHGDHAGHGEVRCCAAHVALPNTHPHICITSRHRLPAYGATLQSTQQYSRAANMTSKY